VISNYVLTGVTLNCPFCKEDIIVPLYAEPTSEDPNVLDKWDFEKPTSISIKKPTFANKIKERFLKINIITGVIAAVGVYIFFKDLVASEIHRILISIGIAAWVSYTIAAFRK